jgi:hypothetical protein
MDKIEQITKPELVSKTEDILRERIENLITVGIPNDLLESLFDYYSFKTKTKVPNKDEDLTIWMPYTNNPGGEPVKVIFDPIDSLVKVVMKVKFLFHDESSSHAEVIAKFEIWCEPEFVSSKNLSLQLKLHRTILSLEDPLTTIINLAAINRIFGGVPQFNNAVKNILNHILGTGTPELDLRFLMPIVVSKILIPRVWDEVKIVDFIPKGFKYVIGTGKSYLFILFSVVNKMSCAPCLSRDVSDELTQTLSKLDDPELSTGMTFGISQDALNEMMIRLLENALYFKYQKSVSVNIFRGVITFGHAVKVGSLAIQSDGILTSLRFRALGSMDAYIHASAFGISYDYGFASTSIEAIMNNFRIAIRVKSELEYKPNQSYPSASHILFDSDVKVGHIDLNYTDSSVSYPVDEVAETITEIVVNSSAAQNAIEKQIEESIRGDLEIMSFDLSQYGLKYRLIYLHDTYFSPNKSAVFHLKIDYWG